MWNQPANLWRGMVASIGAFGVCASWSGVLLCGVKSVAMIFLSGILWILTPCKGETGRRGSRTHAWPSDAFGISWYFPVWSVVRRCRISAILAYIYWLIHTFFFGQVWLHYIHLPGHHCVVGYQMILVTGHISPFNPHGSQPQSCLQSCNLRHILSIFILIYYK